MRAAFDLCLQLGIPHPDYLLGRDRLADFTERGLTSTQWGEWIAYLGTIPLPADRVDLALAGLRANVVNSYARHAVEAERFLPPYGKPRRKVQSEQSLKDQLSGVIAAERSRREHSR